jgi:DNA-directed RNA polymerase subunit RPC12/RpoP
MEDESDWEYECADCGHKMTLRISGAEMRSSLRSDRPEWCPNCGQSVGMGIVSCGQCKTEFRVEMLHWHVHCNLAHGTCPNCGSSYNSYCVC